MNLEIPEDSLVIIVSPNGVSKAYVPETGKISWMALHVMLKQIRKFELSFTELVNKTYAGKKSNL